MLDRPRFKPHLRVEVVPGEGAFVLSDGSQTLLRGRLYERVAPCIGGGRSVDDVCDELDGQITAAEVYYVIAQLEKKGYLCEQELIVPEHEAAWWWARGVDPRAAVRRLAESPVSIRAYGVESGPFVDLLRTIGVRREDESGGVGLGVVLVDGYQRAELAAYNAEALRNGRTWLLLRPVGRQIWIGPLFRPGLTACWECLAHRLRTNSPVATYLAGRNRHVGPVADDIAASPATILAAMGLAANAVASWIVRGELPDLESQVQTLDLASWKAETHRLVRLPYCPACGELSGACEDGSDIRPIVLESRLKAISRDNGYRVVQPEVTLKRYGHHVSPITGAVSMLERIGPAADADAETGSADHGIVPMHVYIAGHNLARQHRSLAHLRSDLRNMSSGKGASDLQARASGLCEGLERYSGVFRGDEVRRRTSARRLGGAAVPLNDCLLFSDRQFRERAAWNARKSHYHFVPVPFDPDAEIDWTPVWSLSRREPRYLPTAFCYFNAPQPDGEPFCIGDSNGNAAGNTLEEAVLQGFLELVERDAVALWWYNRVRRPAVDLDSFADPYLDRVGAYLRDRGRELWVIDLTSDLRIPVFAALSRETDGPEERIVPGFGAHLDPQVALVRAVTEMNQMLSNLPDEAGRPARNESLDDPETLAWFRSATVGNQPYLLSDPDAGRRDVSSYPRSWSDDVAEDVRLCQALVEGQGMEMMVLDQTRAEIGLPVVKVIVPGLRHFWARYAPGRLYDVPARLGWLPAPIPEEELNPIPMFL
ncbi:MAG: TOMM precursor leader peptide-binding protein [Isosphaeraceae bacterium]